MIAGTVEMVATHLKFAEMEVSVPVPPTPAEPPHLTAVQEVSSLQVVCAPFFADEGIPEYSSWQSQQAQVSQALHQQSKC
mmetsp:Transcript_41773/g.83822  ORF Transcript_41773/g.83822 Transcript_41773/m.83822 type:complete len:80 (+) Transcript_41773:1744-1983(+)